VTDPGLTLPLGYDNSGRLSSVGTNGQFMGGFTYNSAGQRTGDTLGNGVTERAL
jgi:YD repeat-containing protein